MDGLGRNVEGLGIDVDKDGFGSYASDGTRGSEERKWSGDDLVAGTDFQEPREQESGHRTRKHKQWNKQHPVSALISFSNAVTSGPRMNCWVSRVRVTASRISWRMVANCAFRSRKGISIFCGAVEPDMYKKVYITT